MKEGKEDEEGEGAKQQQQEAGTSKMAETGGEDWLAAMPQGTGKQHQQSPSATAFSARARPRLFSARVFSASRHRSPFGREDEGDEDEQQPSTSAAGGQRQRQFHHPPGAKHRKNYARTEDGEEEDEGEGGRSKKRMMMMGSRMRMRRRMTMEEEVHTEEHGQVPQATRTGTATSASHDGAGEQFSDIEHIELGEMRPAAVARATLAAPPRLPARGFQRVRRRQAAGKLMTPVIAPLARRGGLAENAARKKEQEKGEKGGDDQLTTTDDEEEAEAEEAHAAFSPRLDIDLGPQMEKQQQQQQQPSASNSRAAPGTPHAPLAPKLSAQLNGSLISGGGGGVPVPALPQITVTSPLRDQIPPLSSQRPPDAVQADLHPQTEPATAAHPPSSGMNPSLLKGISKSIWRFRGRNRINNDQQQAAAREQANFMFKFGIQSGTGIKIEASDGQQSGEGAGAPPEAGGLQRLRHAWRQLVFDANEAYFYRWNALVSTAYVYNLLVVIARSVFVELAAGRLWLLWLALDLAMDCVYLVDMFVRSRTGYLEQGLLVRDCRKIRALYLRSRQFAVDCVSLAPLDHLAALALRRPQPIWRLNRLLRRERIQRFMEQTETRTAMPNAFRVGVVVWYIAVIIHWNACFYFMISESIGLGSDPWVYGVNNKQSLPSGINDTLTRRYIYSFYWSTLILTTIGEVPGPQQNVEFAFVTVDLMCGVLIFATIVGNVGSMIANISADRTEFQNRIDSIKE